LVHSRTYLAQKIQVVRQSAGNQTSLLNNKVGSSETTCETLKNNDSNSGPRQVCVSAHPAGESLTQILNTGLLVLLKVMGHLLLIKMVT